MAKNCVKITKSTFLGAKQWGGHWGGGGGGGGGGASLFLGGGGGGGGGQGQADSLGSGRQYTSTSDVSHSNELEHQRFPQI